MNINYFIDGIDFKTYGVFVSGSDGLISKPKMKPPVVAKWDEYHGEVPDLQNKYYEAREITLSCFILGNDKYDFLQKANAFLSLFDGSGLHRLMVAVDESEPLVYQVYLADSVDVRKEWSDQKMVGTFNIRLREPEPVKKVLKHQKTGEADKTVTLTVTSDKLLNIFWGDGANTTDVSGTDMEVTHTYTANGIYYVVITGDIDKISALTTSATIVWNKL